MPPPDVQPAAPLPALQLPGEWRCSCIETHTSVQRLKQDCSSHFLDLHKKLDQLAEVKEQLKEANAQLSSLDAKISRMQAVGLPMRRRPSIQSLGSRRSSLSLPSVAAVSPEVLACSSGPQGSGTQPAAAKEALPPGSRVSPALPGLVLQSPRSSESNVSSISVGGLEAAETLSAWGSEPDRSRKRSGRMNAAEVCSSDMLRVLSRFSRSDRTMRIWNFLEMPESSKWARLYVRCMMAITYSSLVITFLQSLRRQDGRPPPLHGVAAAILETAFDLTFTLEVLVRFTVCPNRWVFFLSAFNAIDLAAAAPLVLRVAVGFRLPDGDDGSLQWALLVCIVPVLRLLKTLRHFEKFNLLLSAFGIALEALPVLVYTFFVILMIFSSLIYITEPRDNIDSYAMAMWLTVVTMMTVGYGEITPKSAGGYVVISILILGSVLYMAIPIGIVGSAFNRVWEDRERLLLLQRTREHLLRSGFRAQDIPGLFALFDTSQTGELCLCDFHKMMTEMKLGISEDRVVELFESFDRDGSGAICDRELVHELFPEAYAQIYGTGDAPKQEGG